MASDAGADIPEPVKASPPQRQESPLATRMREADVLRPSPAPAPAAAPPAPRQPLNVPRGAAPVRKDGFGTAAAQAPVQRGPEGSGNEQQPAPGSALKSLRDRLIQRQQR